MRKLCLARDFRRFVKLDAAHEPLDIKNLFCLRVTNEVGLILAQEKPRTSRRRGLYNCIIKAVADNLLASGSKLAHIEIISGYTLHPNFGMSVASKSNLIPCSDLRPQIPLMNTGVTEMLAP